MVEYDGLSSIPIDSFSVWVDIKGLPDALMTEEAVEKIRLTLGHVDHVDKLNLKGGSRARRGVETQQNTSPVVNSQIFDRGTLEAPRVSFLLSGISAANLARQLARFRSSPIVASPLKVQVLPMQLPVVNLQHSALGVKCSAEMTLVTMGKHGHGDTGSDHLMLVSYELHFESEIALAYSNGTLIVSPVKRRRVMPNSEDTLGKTGPARARKRSFRARKALMM
ncbi:hypothetical protein ACLB2K_068948 [Fragaria x ananassa]